MGDWADEKAREWLTWLGEQRVTLYHNPAIDPTESLAALLREIKSVRADLERVRLLAEVRRVVDEVGSTPRPIRSELWNLGRMSTCDEILSRLEALK